MRACLLHPLPVRTQRIVMHKPTRQFRLQTVPAAEEMFLTHYEQMFEWALHLTGHDQARAEDLVHDVFVQLRLGSQDFAATENVEAYLFTVLRNLHRSQLTRAQRSPANPSLLVEYDSVAAGLQALHDDAGQRLETLAELRAICQFVCVRKETAKAASALILHFFHGYYPGEVAALLCVSRPAVKELMRMARLSAAGKNLPRFQREGRRVEYALLAERLHPPEFSVPTE